MPTTLLLPNEHLVEILKRLLVAGGTQVSLAEKLEIPAPELARARNAPGSWTLPNLRKALRGLNGWVETRNGKKLTERDLRDRNTVALIRKLPLSPDERTALFRDLHLEVPADEPLEVSVLRTLAGIWAVFYTCRDRVEATRPAIAAATFDIAVHPFERKASIQETSYHPETQPMPEGTIQIRHNTIEVDLDYKEPDFPVAKYLAAVPVHREINCLLLTSLDIKERDRLIVARPILMVRVGVDAEHPRQFNRETTVFEAVNGFLSRFAIYEPNFMELTFSRVPDLHEYDAIREIVLHAWREMELRKPT
jgi:hypothetical protein